MKIKQKTFLKVNLNDPKYIRNFIICLHFMSYLGIKSGGESLFIHISKNKNIFVHVLVLDIYMKFVFVFTIYFCKS